MKKIILVCSIICVILGTKLLWYIYKPEPSIQVNYVGKTVNVVDMDTLDENYKCVQLKRLDGNYLKFCERLMALNVQYGVPMVRGTYQRLEDSIWVDKDSPNDRILHELFHANSLYKGGKRNEEEKAYDFQQLYNQLVKLEYIHE